MDTRSSSPSICLTLIEGLADAEGVDSTELDYTLHDYVDPDALDQLLVGSRTDCRIQFSVADHTVVVDSAGYLTVDGVEHAWDA